MKKAAFPIVCTLFILLGIGFAVLYGTEVPVLCVLSVLEVILTVCSMILRITKKQGAWVVAVYVLTGLLWAFVTLIAFTWALHFVGVELLPPPQR